MINRRTDDVGSVFVELPEEELSQMMHESSLWSLLCSAIDEGIISVILEGSTDTIDGGVIVTEVDDVVEHISK